MMNNVNNAAIEAINEAKAQGIEADFVEAQKTYFDMSFTNLMKSEPKTPAEKLAKAYEVSLRRLTQML